ncbi:MAG: hypothetical protein VKL59_00180 [Nostocaceae cyanobacterium]|nr:hypothetical protein [Nostocaceae cyanobacterium]
MIHLTSRSVAVGWVEERNPNQIRGLVGFRCCSTQPTILSIFSPFQWTCAISSWGLQPQTGVGTFCGYDFLEL